MHRTFRSEKLGDVVIRGSDLRTVMATPATTPSRPNATPPATPSRANRLRITVSEPTVHTENIDTPYATYKIDASEAGRRWVRVARWSEVRRLYERVPTVANVPKLRAHSFRFGAAHLAPDVLNQRCHELRAILKAWVEAFEVSLVAEHGPVVLREFLTGENGHAHGGSPTHTPHTHSHALNDGTVLVHSHNQPRRRRATSTVDEPTPAEFWYTPAGWSAEALRTTRELAPPPLDGMDDAGGDSDEGGGGACGVLWLEVLEAKGLKRVDSTLTQNDVFALVIFEGHALRTATRWDEDDPAWPSDSPRAARLPVVAPFSEVHVALLHEETGPLSALKGDAVPLGRVSLRLSQLHPHSEHDIWLPLQMETFRHAPRTCSALRTTRVARVLHQRPPSRAPSHVLTCAHICSHVLTCAHMRARTPPHSEPPNV